jgi:hypothetical protein
MRTCLRHLAHGCGPLPAEQAAGVSLLQTGIPGVGVPDIHGAGMILQSLRGLNRRQ